MALISLAAGYLLLDLVERYHENQVRQSVLGLARTISLSLRRQPSLSDARRLYSYIQYLRESDPRILAATIVDATGEVTGDLDENQVFTRSADPEILEVLNGKGDVERTSRPDPSVIVATVPVYYPGAGEILGVFRLRYDVGPMQRLYGRARWGVLGTVAVTALLLVGLIGFALNRSVLRPLRTVTRRVETMATGDLSARIPPQRAAELGVLEERFNLMAGRLQASLAELERRRESLEADVASRTSELTAAKKELESLNEALERRIRERTGQLLHAERLAAIGTLASGVAHEINNPVATILACAEGLERTVASRREDVPEALEAKLAHYLPVVLEEARRCRTITSQLLDFARKGKRQMSRTDLRKVIEDAVAITEPRAAAESKSVLIRPSDGPLEVLADAQSLKQVLVNLLINALDASESGGSVTVRAFREEGRACAQVIDQGCGLEREELERVFEPFVTTKGATRGTGLGLTICDMIIHEHDGEIRMESEGKGRGATATFCLALAEDGEGRRA